MFQYAATTGGGSILGLVGPFVLMFVVFYFLLIRPQQKKTKTRNAMLKSLKKAIKSLLLVVFTVRSWRFPMISWFYGSMM